MFVLAAVRWELFGGRDRQEGMGRIGVLLVLVALLAAGCHGGPTESDAGGGKSPETTDDEKRMIDVYAAIIRQLVTKDHTFGSGPSPFERVYVLDGVAADSDAVRSQAAEPFSPAVRAGILEKLRDLPPVEFVSDPGSVVSRREALRPCHRGRSLDHAAPDLGRRGEGLRSEPAVLRLSRRTVADLRARARRERLAGDGDEGPQRHPVAPSSRAGESAGRPGRRAPRNRRPRSSRSRGDDRGCPARTRAPEHARARPRPTGAGQPRGRR